MPKSGSIWSDAREMVRVDTKSGEISTGGWKIFAVNSGARMAKNMLAARNTKAAASAMWPSGYSPTASASPDAAGRRHVLAKLNGVKKRSAAAAKAMMTSDTSVAAFSPVGSGPQKLDQGATAVNVERRSTAVTARKAIF